MARIRDRLFVFLNVEFATKLTGRHRSGLAFGFEHLGLGFRLRFCRNIVPNQTLWLKRQNIEFNSVLITRFT